MVPDPEVMAEAAIPTPGHLHPGCSQGAARDLVFVLDSELCLRFSLSKGTAEFPSQPAGRSPGMIFILCFLRK